MYHFMPTDFTDNFQVPRFVTKQFWAVTKFNIKPTLKVAATFVKLAIPPPMMRILPGMESQEKCLSFFFV